MSIIRPKNTPTLNEIVAVRLSEDECRALVAIAQRDERTISFVVRAQLRRMLEQDSQMTLSRQV